MPFSPKQMKAIRAKKHGWDPEGKQPFEGVSKKKLGDMEKEGVKKGKGKKPGFPFKKKKGKKSNLAAQLEGLKGK
jgi:hypothetical protein